jgi:hypothetical protein
MDPKLWTVIDKSDWGDGPWQDEPDKMEWRDPATGYPCILRRGPRGSLCGYVAVPTGHPLHGKSLYDVDDAPVHGGVTYAAPCVEEHDEMAVCHIPLPGESDAVWWFGHDYSHGSDYTPGDAHVIQWLLADMGADLPAFAHEILMPPNVHYWPWDTVKNEITDLAHYLKARECTSKTENA